MPVVRHLGPPLLAILVILAQAPSAHATGTCPQFFAAGTAPTLVNPKLATKTFALCYGAFAVLYSGVSRTPVYAAERLTRASVRAARAVDRADSFHEETRLPVDARSVLVDYVRSGYDRGHVAPAGDMPTPDAQAESFTLANIVPQNRSANRSLWAAIEESVRRLALKRGDLFVVTGPIFSGKAIASLDGRVLVPTQMFKAVYDPARGEAAAYLADNDSDGAWKPVSMATLKEASGVDVFPALSPEAKARAMSLPEPRAYSRDGGRSGHDEASYDAWMRDLLHRAFRRLWRELMHAIF